MSTIGYFREFSFIDLFKLDTYGKDFDKKSTEGRFISGKDSINYVRTFEHFRFSTLLLVESRTGGHCNFHIVVETFGSSDVGIKEIQSHLRKFTCSNLYNNL